MNASVLLLADTVYRTSFEFGRIQSELDWLAPILATIALAAYVVWMYRRDTVEFRPPARIALVGLRLAAIGLLLLVYLQPQWRNEREVVQDSRVVLLADTSLSMGLHDSDSSPVPAEPSRAEQLVAALVESKLVDRLRETHEVIVAKFDSQLERVATFRKHGSQAAATDTGQPEAADAPEDAASPDPTATSAARDPSAVDWSAVFAPSGTETQLGQALRQIVTEERGAPISGVVIFTDGQHNAGIEPAVGTALAAESAIPIHPVGIGSPQAPANLRVADLVAPTRAFPGDRFTVTGYVQAQQLGAGNATVELYSRAADGTGAADGAAWTLEGREEVALGAEGETVPVKFEIVPAAVGRRTLKFDVVPPRSDSFEGDNTREVEVEIVDAKTRVLLFAGGPTREYVFLRNQFRRDRSVEADVLLQTAQEGVSQDAHKILDNFPTKFEDLVEYDAIVAFDPDWTKLSEEQIGLLERWVAEQAGGLILVAGPIHTDSLAQDQKLAKIRDLYPVEFQKRFASLDDGRFMGRDPWPLEFSSDGRDADFLWLGDSQPLSERAWGEFPGVFGYYAVRNAKPAATVYARFSDPRASAGDTRPPYLVGQFFGAGRVFYLGSGEMWRLRAIDEIYFELFYTKLIRFVTQGRLERGSPRGTLLTERDRYVLGNTVTVQAQLADASLKPLEAPEVTLQVYHPDSTQQNVVLRPDASRAGSYRGQFTVRKEGMYRLELPLPDGRDERLGRRIQVRVPDLEREHPERNDVLLAGIAHDTSGVYYVGLDAALSGSQGQPSLLDVLTDRSRTSIVLGTPDRLWDNWWVLLGVVGLLSAEWLLRRLLRLA